MRSCPNLFQTSESVTVALSLFAGLLGFVQQQLASNLPQTKQKQTVLVFVVNSYWSEYTVCYRQESLFTYVPDL